MGIHLRRLLVDSNRHMTSRGYHLGLFAANIEAAAATTGAA